MIIFSYKRFEKYFDDGKFFFKELINIFNEKQLKKFTNVYIYSWFKMMKNDGFYYIK